MSFFETLVSMAIGIFAITIVILYASRHGETSVARFYRRSKKQFFIYLTIFLIFILLSLYELFLGSRSTIWFSLFGLIACCSLYFSNSTLRQRRLSLFVIIFLISLQSVTPKLQNRGIIYGPDEWRDLRVTGFIMDTGTFIGAPYFEGDYYSVFPLFNILNAVISSIMGCDPMLLFTLMPCTLSLISSLATYLIMYRITKNYLLAFLILIISSSLPRGASGQYIPAALSGSLGTLLVLLLAFVCFKISRNNIMLCSIMVFVISLIHPIGALLAILLSFGLLVATQQFRGINLPNIARFSIRGFFLTCFLISCASWGSNPTLLNGLASPIIRLLMTLVNFGKGGTYTPLYQSQGLEIYTYPWVVPVSLSAALFLFSSKDLLRHKISKKSFEQLFFWTVAAIGLILILVTFVSVFSNPSAAVERYTNSIAYTLLAFSTSFVFSAMLHSRRVFAILAIVLLFGYIVIGASSPDNAPFEHESFGAVRIKWISTVEAQRIALLLNKNVKVYSDHDIEINYFINQSGIQEQPFQSYQQVRAILNIFKNGSFVPFAAKYTNSAFVIKADEIQNVTLFDNYVNVIYNSERHVTIMIPSI